MQRSIPLLSQGPEAILTKHGMQAIIDDIRQLLIQRERGRWRAEALRRRNHCKVIHQMKYFKEERKS